MPSAYGYRPKLGSPGEMEIQQDEADVVRRIFREYANGRTPREIAIGLNADRIAPPRGAAWTASTINGNAKRGHGIILNPIYRGELIWNRVRMVKDPETGRRVSRVNAESDWKRADAPHLRIIDEDLSVAALALKGEKSIASPQRSMKRKHLLSGLLKCGSCGGGLSVKDRSAGRIRVQCTMAKEAGTCENRRTYFLDMIEPAVTGGLREKLADRRAIAVYINAYNAERQRLAAGAIERRAKAEVRQSTLKRQIDRILDLMIEESITGPAGKERMRPLRDELALVEAELGQLEPAPNVVSLHPAAVADYLATIQRLDAAIRDGDDRAYDTVKDAIRSLVDKVVVSHAEDGALDIEVVGHLASLIGGQAFPQMTLGGVMVAGEGLEPPTRGL
jgi:site-specific DNA recombinase